MANTANPANPFYIEPLGGHNPLAGLGMLSKGIEQGKKRKKEESDREMLASAISSVSRGDRGAANKIMQANPHLIDRLEKVEGYQDKTAKMIRKDGMYQVITGGPDVDILPILQNMKQHLVDAGIPNTEQTDGLISLAQSNPDQAKKAVADWASLTGSDAEVSAWHKWNREQRGGGDPVDGIPIDRDKNIVNPRTGEVIYQGATGGVRPLPPSYTAGLTPEGRKRVNDAFLSVGGRKDGLDAARKERESVKGAERWKQLEPVLRRRFPNATPEEMTEMIDSAQAHEKFSSGIAAAEKLSETHEKKRAFEGEINSVNEAYKILVGGKDGVTEGLDMIYGSKEWMMPDIARSQKGKEMLGARKQIVSSLKLVAASKLKGQGTISESERTTLAEAATILGDESISPTTALKQLNLAMEVIYAKEGKEFVPYQSGVEGQEGEVIPDTAKKQNQLSRLEQLKARRGGR